MQIHSLPFWGVGQVAKRADGSFFFLLRIFCSSLSCFSIASRANLSRSIWVAISAWYSAGFGGTGGQEIHEKEGEKGTIYSQLWVSLSTRSTAHGQRQKQRQLNSHLQIEWFNFKDRAKEDQDVSEKWKVEVENSHCISLIVGSELRVLCVTCDN